MYLIVTVSINYYELSISFWFSFGSLQFLSTWSISAKVSILCAQNCSQNSLIIHLMPLGSVIISHLHSRCWQLVSFFLCHHCLLFSFQKFYFSFGFTDFPYCFSVLNFIIFYYLLFSSFYLLAFFFFFFLSQFCEYLYY